MIISDPPDPIAAVTHPDPYPYYADLVDRMPFYRDERLGLWVASSAAAVEAVFASDICRVRPLAEPVPSALQDSPAADVFRHLVRMNDGERHHSLKRTVSATMHALVALPSVKEEARTWARILWWEQDSDMPQAFPFHLPAFVVASLSGVPQEQLREVAEWVDDFARCLAPVSTPAQIEQGKVAAGHLLDLFASLLQDSRRPSIPNLLSMLSEQAASNGCEDSHVIAANAIGFLFQAYEATAGLIGNTMVTLAAYPDAAKQVRLTPALLRPVIAEVLRYDAPIQNTRRFISQNGSILGQDVRAGDAILVVLAAANRDPAVNPHPEHFDPSRQQRHLYTFGRGPHACPGEMVAAAIACAGVEQLLAAGLVPQHVRATYRPSANARIALLSTQKNVVSP